MTLKDQLSQFGIASPLDDAGEQLEALTINIPEVVDMSEALDPHPGDAPVPVPVEQMDYVAAEIERIGAVRVLSYGDLVAALQHIHQALDDAQPAQIKLWIENVLACCIGGADAFSTRH